MTTTIKNLTLDQERALYNTCDAIVQHCTFAGDADGESALKESKNVTVENCDFCLRYPLWHCKNATVNDSFLRQTCRAPMWYDDNITLNGCTIEGVKALRECNGVKVKNCQIESTELGWKCNDVTITDSTLKAEYLLLLSANVTLNNVKMSGKYSFQYLRNSTIKDSVLDTKDALWHAENVVVSNCVVKGEYLGWYCSNVTFVNCKISGTQPFCYCNGLKLIDCTMEDCDLSFEYSDVQAKINGHVTSVKNPRSGVIQAQSIGEIILQDSVLTSSCKIVTKE